MAPEQLEGKEGDARGDIWALGATLYEMATGQKPFEGASQASLISSILRDEPRPMQNFVPMSPPALDRAVRQCLTKDPQERWQSAGDLRRELEWLVASGAASSVTPGMPSTSASTASAGSSSRTATRVGAPGPLPRSRWLLLALPAAIAVGALLGVWIASRNRSSAAPATLQASILPPPGAVFSSSVTSPIPLAMSPDGSRIVYCARVGEGSDRLWVRSLATGDAHELAGTEGAQQPFFSPDGRALGFFAESKLKRVEVDGGPVITLASATDPRGGSWSARGVIVFAPDYRTPIFRVAADGGPAVATTVLDSTLHEETHRYPFFLPDGRHFLYLARRAGAGAGAEPTIYAGALDSPERVGVVGVASNVVYASGHLLYVRQSVLMAQPFDAKRLRVNGAAVSLLPDVRMDERFSRGVFSASQNGILACMVGKASTRSQLLWVDRTGKRLGAVGEPATYFFGGAPEVSPDGTRAAITIVNEMRGQSDVWIVDLTSGSRRQLTVGEIDHYACSWGSDGHRVFMNSLTRPNAALSFCASDGSAYRDLDLRGVVGQDLIPWDESRDGRYLLVTRNPGADILALPLEGQDKVLELAAGPTNENWPQFSPDGRFVSYASDQSGRDEVYAATFPQSDARWQVSQNGGVEPRWSRDGRELLFFDRDNHLNAVEVRPDAATFEPGASRTLFQLHGAGGSWRYDTAPDGSRFLVSVPVEEEASRGIVLITNWTAALPRSAK